VNGTTETNQRNVREGRKEKPPMLTLRTLRTLRLFLIVGGLGFAAPAFSQQPAVNAENVYKDTCATCHDNPVSGIGFDVKGPGSYANSGTTGDDGHVVFTDLPSGKFTISEVAPAGYSVALYAVHCTRDGAASRNFVTNKFRRDVFRNGRPERLTTVLEANVGAFSIRSFECLLAPEIFPNRDVLHFRSDDSTSCVV